MASTDVARYSDFVSFCAKNEVPAEMVSQRFQQDFCATMKGPGETNMEFYELAMQYFSAIEIYNFYNQFLHTDIHCFRYESFNNIKNGCWAYALFEEHTLEECIEHLNTTPLENKEKWIKVVNEFAAK